MKGEIYTDRFSKERKRCLCQQRARCKTGDDIGGGNDGMEG
jgi:hypothetical protein